MPSRAHLLSATATAFASLAAATGIASADTYCVAKPACAAQPGGHAAADLPAAIAAAAAHAGADRVEIGPGTFPFPAGGTPTVQSSNDVTEIAGAGREATILTGGPDDKFALEIEHAGTVVSDLGIVLPAGAESRGINLDAAGAVGRRIDIKGPQVADGQGVGIDAGAKLEDTRIVLPTTTATYGVYVYGSGGATLDGVSITAGYALRVNSNTATTTVTRSRLRASYVGAYIQSPNELAIEDSLLESLTGSYQAVGVETGAAGTTTTARITRSTLVSPGSHPLVELASYTAGATAKAILRGVALVGTGTPFGRSQTVGTTSFDVDRSAFGPGYVTKPADVFGTHNLGAPTGFVNAAGGDYRLRFDSPLVDAAGVVALPGGALDLDGGKRLVDGKGDGSAQADVGAFEYQRRAPVFDASASTGAAPIGTPISFLMSNVSDPDPGETATLRWDFSDGTSAAGAAVQHAFGAAPGGITATAIATDPAGVTTSKALHAEIIPAATTTTTDGGATPGVGSGSGTGATGAGGPATPGTGSASALRVGKPRFGSDGRLRVRVTCAGTQRCQGTLALRAAKGKKRVGLGKKTFTLKAGASRTLLVALGKKARAALPKGRGVRVVATATGRDGAGRTLAAASKGATLKRR